MAAPSFTFSALFRHDLQELLIIFFPGLLLAAGLGAVTILCLDPIRIQSLFALLPSEYQNTGTLLMSAFIEYTIYIVGFASAAFGIYLQLNFFRDCLNQLEV